MTRLSTPSRFDLAVGLSVADPSDAELVKIGLGQYYQDNYTRASGWTVTYVVNRTTHNIAGLTASLIQTVAYDNYISNVQPGIASQIGIAMRKEVKPFGAKAR